MVHYPKNKGEIFMRKKRVFPILLCLVFCLTACRILSPDAQPTAEPTQAPAQPTEEWHMTPDPTEAPKAGEATEAPQQPANPTPDLAFETTTLSGEAISSDIFKDYDLVILNVWAEWCGPCVSELPALEKLHRTYPNVLIIGAWIGDDKPDALDTLTRAGVTYPTVSAWEEETLFGYATRSPYIPATYFFDRSGSETGRPVSGAMNYAEWDATVKGLLP